MLKEWGDSEIAFCFYASEKEEFCLHDQACINESQTCASMPHAGYWSQCMIDCGGENLNTSENCNEQEMCMKMTGNYETENNAQDEIKICIPGANASECGDGFECTEVLIDYNTGTTEFQCQRPKGFCGTPGNFRTDFSATGLDNLLDDYFNNDEPNLCELPKESVLCGHVEGFTGETACAFSPHGLIYQNPQGDKYPCEQSIDCTLLGGDCLHFGGTTGQVCGIPATICAAYCEDEEGGNEVACPTGQTCDIPAPLNSQNEVMYIGYPIIEGGYDNPKACPNGAGCDTEKGFSCVDFVDGKYCARSRKLCAEVHTGN